MKRKIMSGIMIGSLLLALLPLQAKAGQPLGGSTVEVDTAAELKDAFSGTATTIRMTGDITDLDTEITVSRQVTFDLNGYVLKQTGDCAVFYIPSSGNLTISDSSMLSANPPEHKFTVDAASGLWTWDETAGTRTITGGVITGGKGRGAEKNGGAIYIDAGACTIQGGSIVGSQAVGSDFCTGGGICVKSGSLTMNNGSIVGCISQGGAGVDFLGNASFTMAGGSIRECCGLNGGISMGCDATFTMTGGSVMDCKRKSRSAVSDCNMRLQGIFYMKGGTIGFSTGSAGKDAICMYDDGTMYADGGTVDGKVQVVDSGRIKTSSAAAKMTNFMQEVHCENGGRLEGGNYLGGISGTVSGCEASVMVEGALYLKQLVPSGECLREIPQPAQRMGYRMKWYQGNQEYTTQTRIQSNLTLEGRWVENSHYTIDFEGAKVLKKTGIKWTDKVLAGVTDPTKDGYIFLGWKYGNQAVTGNTTYAELTGDDTISGIVLTAQWRKDTEKPVITGLKENGIYCKKVTFTVSDNQGIEKVTVNGVEQTPDADGKYMLRAASDPQEVVVTDVAGNSSSISVLVKKEHSGGKSTCCEKAVCENCQEEYGLFDPSYHGTLKHVKAKAATTEKVGNIEYWYCVSCEKYFADKNGKKEVSKEEVTIAALKASSKTQEGEKSPKTGESVLCGTLFIIALVGGMGVVYTGRRKKVDR